MASPQETGAQITNGRRDFAAPNNTIQRLLPNEPGDRTRSIVIFDPERELGGESRIVFMGRSQQQEQPVTPTTQA